jgi:hypothetical protein
MKIPLNLKPRNEGALDRPGDCWLWAVLHLRLACPGCGKVFEPEGDLHAISMQPLSIIEPLKCPSCEIVFAVKGGQLLVNEPALPPLHEGFCFLCSTPIGVTGAGIYKTGNCPPLCRDCMQLIVGGHQDTIDKILQKGRDYGLEIKL